MIPNATALFAGEATIALPTIPTQDKTKRIVVNGYLSCTRPPVHDDSFCFVLCWNCGKRYRRFSCEQRGRVGYHAGRAASLLLLEQIQTLIRSTASCLWGYRASSLVELFLGKQDARRPPSQDGRAPSCACWSDYSCYTGRAHDT